MQNVYLKDSTDAIKVLILHFSNVKRLVLWQHYKLCHAHHGPEVPCLAQDGCPHRFKSYTSFKSHYSRIHNKDADKECADGCKIQCIKCNMMDQKRSWHTLGDVSSHSCRYEGCSFGSNVATTFRSHMSRTHCKDVALLKSHLRLVPSCSTENTTGEHEQVDSEPPSGLHDDFVEDIVEAISDDDDMQEKTVHTIAALCLRMQCVFNIPFASVDEILKCLTTISSFDSLHLCGKIQQAVLGLGYNDSQLVARLKTTIMKRNIVVNCTRKSSNVSSTVQGVLSTNDRRMTYYKAQFPYVAPVEYKLR